MQLSRCKERKHVKQSYLYQHVFYNLYRFLSLWVYRSKPKTEIEKGKSGGLEKCNIQSFEFIRVFGCQSDLRRNKLQFSLYSNIDLHLHLLKLHKSLTRMTIRFNHEYFIFILSTSLRIVGADFIPLKLSAFIFFNGINLKNLGKTISQSTRSSQR